MTNNESIKDPDVAGTVWMGRRRFIRWLGAAAGSFAAMRRVASATRASTAIPMPRYIPAGYSLLGEYRGEPDGFRTGNAEIKFAYRNPKLIGRVFSPLFVFVSPMTDNRFGGLVDHTPEPVTFRIGNENIEGEYFDGFWVASPYGERIVVSGRRLHWDTSNLNALVFPFDGHMIGILGSKQGGVGRTELIKIASSFGPVTR